MNLFKKTVLSLCFALPTMAHALPTLQLDIVNGRYDTATETTVATSDPFTLKAYLQEDGDSKLSNDYVLSMALTPKVANRPQDYDFGSFSMTYAGQTYTFSATADMAYGFAPLETVLGDHSHDARDLGPHGIFGTYFREFAFNFDTSTVGAFNVVDDSSANGVMFDETFQFDLSNLDPTLDLHFDLYQTTYKGSDIDIVEFAPFSHDAQSGRNPVPAPAPLALMGLGLLAFAASRKRKYGEIAFSKML